MTVGFDDDSVEMCAFAIANGGHAEDGCEECVVNPGTACCEHCDWDE